MFIASCGRRQSERRPARGSGSGVRLGTPAVTTRGMGEAEMVEIASFINDTLKAPADENNLTKIRSRVEALTKRFPLYPELIEKYK